MPTDTHQLRGVVLGDRAEGWSALGFSVRSTGDGTGAIRLGNTAIELTGSTKRFEGWTIDGVDVAIDGLPTPSTHAGATSPEDLGDEHPNGIVSIDHVVISTGDVERTAAAFEANGVECRGDRSTSSYGSPMRQLFFWLGDVIAEVVGPGDGEPTTDGPAALFGLAFVSADLELTGARMGPLLGSPKDAVQRGRRIAGIRGQEAGIDLPLAVMSPHVT